MACSAILNTIKAHSRPALFCSAAASEARRRFSFEESRIGKAPSPLRSAGALHRATA